ncbi:cytochrome c oxidase subunit II [candidate division KSB1 bacterium]|nr:cytochrome c oxidase subunit II [candidate division KSB1 bacterium]
MIIDPSNISGTVNHVFFIITGVCVLLLVLITVLMISFVIKYHHKRNKNPKDIHGNLALEITWTVIPTILVMGMFYYGWIGYRLLRQSPADSMIVKATGQMWKWGFEYENGVKSDTLYVPVNKPIKMLLHSQDVIHSFFIPAFRVKHDVLPGNAESYLWFKASNVGKFDVFCSEYCGQQHSYMRTKVVSMPENEFQKWLATQTIASTTSDSVAQAIAASSTQPVQVESDAHLVLLAKKGCLVCHSTDGTPMTGPTLKQLFGTKQIVVVNEKDTTITVDDNYLRQSLVAPNAALVKGFPANMPSQQNVSTPEEIDALVDALKKL